MMIRDFFEGLILTNKREYNLFNNMMATCWFTIFTIWCVLHVNGLLNQCYELYFVFCLVWIMLQTHVTDIVSKKRYNQKMYEPWK